MYVLLYLAVAASALAVVRMRHQARQVQAGLQEAHQRSQDLAAEARQLELEHATLAAPARIERLARRKLKMRAPVEIVVPSTEPRAEPQP